ncbi:MAG TPA: zf-HC2 domain-containing protein [Bryobacteraceae bacterium]|nr:zf-HC2 domain-containing protein [Bryobacteraceae bacterium]
MLSCEQFEVLLADHIDGALAEAAREEFVRHLEACAACAAYAAEVQSAVSFMEIAADVEPPADLTGKILHATNAGWEFKLRARGVRGWINRTFAPVLKPRFVMGAMLTMMSITMLSRCAGDPKKPLTAADLDPVRLWSSLDVRTHRLWDRTVKSYDSMRLVYEIRTQLNEWKQQQAEADEAAAQEHANSRKLNNGAPEKTSATPDNPQETQQK